ncbi:hypothetical protein Cgig2_015775 [Carnegiea gigantea]|uniref:Uncharacterized protein n=1 Tax=Carnegiea gigantea TaxID=171969 RepID=A0A9Q1KIE5_9CARY|nr:hypothetical protein Cgig2_015775 [Carnegiea gigantea]
MSNVNVMADHDVFIKNLRYDIRRYEDIDLNILDVGEKREEEENDEEEEAEEEEFEDFFSDEDEELGVGDMCLDDSGNEDDDPDSDDESTPSNTAPSANASPSPTPGTTSIPNRTSPLPNPDCSSFSSPRIQTPVFNSEESPQLDVDADCIQEEERLRFDQMKKDCFAQSFMGKSFEKALKFMRENMMLLILHGGRFINQFVICGLMNTRQKYVQKLSETQATQTTQATFDGSIPSSPSQPSYNEQMKIWIDTNGLTKGGRLRGFGPEGDIYTNSQGPCSIQNHGKAYTNTFATFVDKNKSHKKVLDDVQAKLTLELAKSKKQTKKVHKNVKTTQDI